MKITEKCANLKKRPSANGATDRLHLGRVRKSAFFAFRRSHSGDPGLSGKSTKCRNARRLAPALIGSFEHMIIERASVGRCHGNRLPLARRFGARAACAPPPLAAPVVVCRRARLSHTFVCVTAAVKSLCDLIRGLAGDFSPCRTDLSRRNARRVNNSARKNGNGGTPIFKNETLCATAANLKPPKVRRVQRFCLRKT